MQSFVLPQGSLAKYVRAMLIWDPLVTIISPTKATITEPESSLALPPAAIREARFAAGAGRSPKHCKDIPGGQVMTGGVKSKTVSVAFELVSDPEAFVTVTE